MYPLVQDYAIRLKIYIDMVSNKRKKDLMSFVSQVEDLGPEVLLNLPLLDAYRYSPQACAQYLEIYRSIVKTYSWDVTLKKGLHIKTDNDRRDTEPDGRASVVNNPDKFCNITWFSDDVQMNCKMDSRAYFPLSLIDATPFVFHLMNQCLADCNFKSSILDAYHMYATMLMCQPLPFSLIPLETERIILNEKLLPGLTKIQRIAQDFP
jgi:hypothetical protein